MKPIQTSLVHRVIDPPRAPGMLHPALIMLHGRGADEEDLAGLSSYLSDRLLVLSARAPFPFDQGGGFTWYDVGAAGRPEPTTFGDSFARLSSFVDDVLARYPVDRSHLYLMGFSMGAVMSFALSLARPGIFAGVAPASGYVPEQTDLTFRWRELDGTSFLIMHGVHDTVIPIAMARRARELVASSTARWTYREYPMGHEISEESLADLSRWLTALLQR